MHKMDNGYKTRYNSVEMDRMFDVYHENTYKCKCGHSVAIPYDMEKKLCSYCGIYVFKDKKKEFEYRMREVLEWKKRI